MKENKLVSFIQNKISDRAMKIAAIVLICVYYFIGLMSYITVPIKPIYSLFVSTSLFAVILRAVMCAIICLFSLIVLFKYNLKMPWKWFVLFCFILFMTLICILISPMVYEYMYVENLYKVIDVIRLNPGIKQTAVSYLSSIADFAFAFCILFILPYMYQDKKKLLWLLLPIIGIAVLECFYSIIKERAAYIAFFKDPGNPNSGYALNIRATFVSKQDWGAFLGVAFASSLSCFFILGKNRIEKALKIVFLCLCFMFYFFVVCCLCKTAILGIGLCFITLLIGLIVISYKKSFKLGIILSCIFGCLFLGLIIAISFDGFGINILSKISTLVKSLLFNQSESAVEARSSIWLNYIENVRGYNMFFGFGKAYVSTYSASINHGGHTTIHNGLAYFFASYGLAGFMLLISLFGVVLFRIIKTRKINPFYPFMFIGLFLIALIFILAESEVLVVSSSTPIFVFNVLLVLLPQGMLFASRNKEAY